MIGRARTKAAKSPADAPAIADVVTDPGYGSGMWHHAFVAVVLMLSLGCGGSGPRSKSAASPAPGVQSYIDVLRADDPGPAYALLSDEVRRQMSFEEFAAQWKDSAAERTEQAQALQQRLEGAPPVQQHAVVVYPDGQTVHIVQEDGAWHLESAIVAPEHASGPHDAVRIFVRALEMRDIRRVMRILTVRRQDSIGAQLDAFVTSLGRRLAGADNTIEIFGKDRAELRWDDDGRQYKIVLRKEGDEWRVDDVHLRPAPAAEAE